MEGTRARVDKIRARLDHPIIDSDGHDIEYLPLVREELRALPRFFDDSAVSEAARKERRS